MSKYHNKKVFYDGMWFDSVREKHRYIELKLLQRAGEISNLNCQTPFGLLPKQYIGKKVKEREVKYVADFTYITKDGEFVVEDAKGMRTREYILKRKMMLYFHGIEIKEV